MKKGIKYVFGILILIVISTNSSFGQFYYSGGQQNQLFVDSHKVCIKFETIVNPNDQTIILDSIPEIVTILNDGFSIDGFVICSLSNVTGYNTLLNSVLSVDGISLVEPYYLTSFGSPYLVGDRFCVAFESTIDQPTIDSINAKFGVEVIHELVGMPNVFVLRNNTTTSLGLLELAKIYYELSQTRYAHPIVKVSIEAHSYKLFDYFNSYQPHIKRVIGVFNTASVWDFAGLTESVTVAVIDNGVDNGALGEGEHEDLPASRVLAGRNLVESILPPVPSNQDYHGMACAGIISASHTTDSISGLDSNSGVISISPNSHILPVKVFDALADSVPTDSLVNAINYAWMNGADVLSNSWGYVFSTCAAYPDDLVDDAILNAFTSGRSGKGCPVIFSSGNQANFHTPVRYPACVPSAFSVGAIHLNDSIWDYSNYGSSLDIVAPSGDVNRQGDVWTIDQMGKDGANTPGGVFTCQPGHPIDGDYYCSFGGTSAAAPIVSGVAALLISKDSSLFAYEIYDILRFSAVTELDSDTITPPDTAYGYGRVDAFRAILSISRGDLNNDNDIATVLDLTYLIDRIYRGGADPFPSPLMGDLNCDGSANNIVDLTYLVDRIFRGGPPPINPCYEF